MLIKYVVYEAITDTIPNNEEMGLEDFKKALIDSKNKSEIARFSYYEDAAKYLGVFNGRIDDDLENAGGIYVTGYYVKAMGETSDGRLVNPAENIVYPCENGQTCEIMDNRVKIKINYFEDNEMDLAFYEENRPCTNVGESLYYDKAFINRILNKETIQEEDKKTIAMVVNRMSDFCENIIVETNLFEKYLIGVLGDNKYVDICKGFYKTN